MIDQGFIRSNNHHLPVVAYIYTIWKDDFGHSKSNFLHFYVYRCDNLLSKTDADGYVTRYSYTALDLVQKINYNGAKEVSYQYNKVGEAEGDSGKLTFQGTRYLNFRREGAE